MCALACLCVCAVMYMTADIIRHYCLCVHVGLHAYVSSLDDCFCAHLISFHLNASLGSTRQVLPVRKPFLSSCVTSSCNMLVKSCWSPCVVTLQVNEFKFLSSSLSRCSGCNLTIVACFSLFSNWRNKVAVPETTYSYLTIYQGRSVDELEVKKSCAVDCPIQQPLISSSSISPVGKSLQSHAVRPKCVHTRAGFYISAEVSYVC